MVRHVELGTAGGRASGVDEASPCTIEAWVGLLESMLDLPDAERRSICEEIEAHLLERVRDLELTGHASDDAVRQALVEVGEAAGLARSLRSARARRIRRTVMNATIIGISGIGVTVGVLSTLSGSRPIDFTVFQPAAALPPAAVAGLEVIGADDTLGGAIEAIGATAELPVVVNWTEMPLEPTFDLGLSVDGLSIDRACAIVLERMGTDASVAWRFHPDYIELADAETIDYRERTLLAYDIDSILSYLWAAYDIDQSDAKDQISDLLHQFVEPDHWENNGGRVAQMQVVGGRMFVIAPPRMHERVRWLLAELEHGTGVAGDPEHAGGRGGGVARTEGGIGGAATGGGLLDGGSRGSGVGTGGGGAGRAPGAGGSLGGGGAGTTSGIAGGSGGPR